MKTVIAFVLIFFSNHCFSLSIKPISTPIDDSCNIVLNEVKKIALEKYPHARRGISF